MPKLIATELAESIVDFKKLREDVAPADIRLKRAPSASIFDRAQNTVLSLIEKDSFMRWRKAVREQLDANTASASVNPAHTVQSL